MKGREGGGQIAGDHRVGLKPEAGEGFALDDAALIRFDALVPARAQPEPIEGPIDRAPDDVFLHTVAEIDAEFLMEVDAHIFDCPPQLESISR